MAKKRTLVPNALSKTCPGCKVERLRSEYSNNRCSRDALQTYCKSCNSISKTGGLDRIRGWNHKNTLLGRAIMDGELARGCIDCGAKDFDILEFDHRPGTIKKIEVAAMKGSGPRAIYAEIDKCDVRCANCHRKVTAIRARASGRQRSVFV